MTELYFILRHIPFWAIPLIIIGGEFGYYYWLKKKRRGAILSLMVALIGLMATSFYFWAGGPQKSVQFVKKLHREHSE